MALARDDTIKIADEFIRWMKDDMDKRIFDALAGTQKIRRNDGEFFVPKRVLESLEPSEIAVARESAFFLSGDDVYTIEGDGKTQKLTKVTLHSSLTGGVTIHTRKEQASRTPTFYRIIGADYDMHQKIEKLEQTNDALAKEVEELRVENSRLRELINTLDCLRLIREFKVFYEMKKAASDEQEKKNLG